MYLFLINLVKGSACFRFGTHSPAQDHIRLLITQKTNPHNKRLITSSNKRTKLLLVDSAGGGYHNSKNINEKNMVDHEKSDSIVQSLLSSKRIDDLFITLLLTLKSQYIS